MQAGRLSVLMLLLLGWMWLSPGLPVLAQTTTAPNVLPKILEFDRKLCPYLPGVGAGHPGRQGPVSRPVRRGKTLHRRGGCAVPPV